MYSILIDSLLLIETLKTVLIGVGLCTAISAIALWIAVGSEAFKDAGRPIVISFVLLFLSIGSIVVYNVPYMKPEWIIARQVARQIDKYNDKNPEAIYNPEVMLDTANDVILGLAGSVTELPKTVSKLLSGKTVAEIKIDLEQKEFEAWKASRNAAQ
jgi:hypothetical protein